MDKSTLETAALQLKSLLAVFAAIDGDNTTAISEMPIALIPAVELAEKLYCGIVNMEEV